MSEQEKQYNLGIYDAKAENRLGSWDIYRSSFDDVEYDAWKDTYESPDSNYELHAEYRENEGKTPFMVEAYDDRRTFGGVFIGRFNGEDAANRIVTQLREWSGTDDSDISLSEMGHPRDW